MDNFTPADFATPEAVERATAVVLSDHFNKMRQIADAEILAVFNLGRMNIDILKELMEDVKASDKAGLR